MVQGVQGAFALVLLIAGQIFFVWNLRQLERGQRYLEVVKTKVASAGTLCASLFDLNNEIISLLRENKDVVTVMGPREPPFDNLRNRSNI